MEVSLVIKIRIIGKINTTQMPASNIGFITAVFPKILMNNIIFVMFFNLYCSHKFCRKTPKIQPNIPINASSTTVVENGVRRLVKPIKELNPKRSAPIKNSP